MEFRRKSDWIHAIASILLILLQTWLGVTAQQTKDAVNNVQDEVQTNGLVGGSQCPR